MDLRVFKQIGSLCGFNKNFKNLVFLNKFALLAKRSQKRLYTKIHMYVHVSSRLNQNKVQSIKKL